LPDLPCALGSFSQLSTEYRRLVAILLLLLSAVEAYSQR
jgi:hypothetical protein